MAHPQNAYPVEKQSQTAVGSVRSVHNSLKKFFLPGSKQYSIYFFVNFDFGVFSIFISPDLCPKLAKHDFNRDEKRVKTEGCEHIPTIVFLNQD